MDSDEHISLEDQRSYDDLFRKQLLPDGFAGLKRLKYLRIRRCETEECLANAPATTIVFPVLEELDFYALRNLREICRGPVPEGSFGKLTSIKISNCFSLEYLFPLQILGCLTQLKHLTILGCTNMKEVIWKEQGDTHIATNGIEFRNLEFLYLGDLRNLVGFCTWIDQIDFPKLRCMHLSDFSKRLFDIKSSLSSNSEQNFDVGKQIFDSPNASSIFPQKVTFPCLEDLSLKWLQDSELQISPFLTVQKLVVSNCYNLRYVFNSSMARHLVHLKELNISNCSEMHALVDWEEEIEDGQERKVDTTLFPQLSKLQLDGLSNLTRLCHGPVPGGFFGELTSVEIRGCNNLRYVFNSSMARHLVHLKELNISNCSKMDAVVDWEEEIEDGQERKVDTTLFPQLSKLQLNDLSNLRRLCRGQVPGGSFGELTSVEIRDCNNLENLFQPGCLTQLERLTIQRCAKMKEVIWKEQGDAHIATNGIEFRNLEFLYLESLPSLVGFCTGIDQIDFPRLKCMCLRNFRHFKGLFDVKSSLSFDSDQNFDVGSLSLFPQKVTFPCLEDLILQGLHNWGDKYFSELLISSFPTVKKLEVSFFHGSRYVFHSSLAGHLVHLKELNISNCGNVEAVFGREDEIEDGQERKVYNTLFPQLSKLQLNDLPNLRRFCHFTHTLELPMLSELDIRWCPSMEEFSLGHVSTPNLSLPGISWNYDLNIYISWNGDLNNAIRLLQEKAKREKAKRERFVVVKEDFKKQYRVTVDDIHDEDDFKKRPRVADQGEPHSIQASKIYELAPDIEHENVRDGDRHDHLEDSFKMEVDSCESDSNIERNNNMIPWRETLPPNPQRGRCICFRTADLYTGKSVITRFYSVPFDFFGDGGDDDDVNSSSSDVEGLKCFYECTDFATTSRLSSVGSSLFVVGGSEETGPYKVSITTKKMYRFDTTAPENDWYKWDELSMCTPRAFPTTVTMDGKLYIFGGSGPGSPDAPLAEMFNPRSESSTCESLPRPPSFHVDGWRHLIVAALQPSKKILVASGLSDVVSVYNVVTGVWEELDHKVDFSSVQDQAAVVQNGHALCWCSNNLEEVHAYHLVHKRWFKSPIKGLDEVGMRDPDGMTHYCPIFPLDDNHLCLLWKDHMGYDGTNLPLLHYIKIQVSIDPGGSRLDAVVVASRTYALGLDESIFDAHVFLGEDDEGGERGSGQGGHENRGRTWERSG